MASDQATLRRPVSTVDPFRTVTGRPELRLNNTLRGLDTLPLRVVAA